MTFAIHLELPPSLPRAALLAALGLDDDPPGTPPSVPVELGRAATGATAALVPEDPAAGRYTLAVPLVRAPWSGPDLLPAVRAAVRGLGGRCAPEDPLAAWLDARRAALRQLAALCEAQGAPPPPFMPRAHVDALHQWLLAIDAAPAGPPLSRTVYCLDPRDGSATRLAVRLPAAREAAGARLPPVGGVLADLDDSRAVEAPLLFALDALGGASRPDEHGFFVVDVARARAHLAEAAARGDAEELGRFRIVTPVEVVEAEALADGPPP